MKKILKEVTTVDYIRYQTSLKQLIITRNPFGFVNSVISKTKGLKKKEPEYGDITNEKFF